MNGNLRAPIWLIPVLVMVLAIGAFASVVALNHSTADLTEASNIDGLGFTGGSEVKGDALVGTTHATGTSVTALTGSIFPDDPGDPTRLRLDFTVSGTTAADNGPGPSTTDGGGLEPGDEIIVTLEDDFGYVVEQPLVVSKITISADLVTDAAGLCTVGGPLINETRQPDGVNVDFVGPENDLLQVTVTVPDMSTDDGSGTNSICDAAVVTVIFHQGAGIVNGRESNDYGTDVTTTEDLVAAEVDLNVRARLELADNDDDRGSKEPLLILGIEGKEGVIAFLDNDGDGVRDAVERDLCSVTADADDTAQCDIILNNPPFFPGEFAAQVDSGTTLAAAVAATNTTVTVADGTKFKIGQDIVLGAGATKDSLLISGIAGGVLTVAPAGFAHTSGSKASIEGNCTLGIMQGCNFINFIGSEGRTTGSPTGLTQADVDRQTMELEPHVQITPSSANVGDTVTFSLFDYPSSVLVTLIEISKIDVTPVPFSVTTGPSGEVSFGFIIPGVAKDGVTRVPTGKRRVDVTAGGRENDTNLTISGANLSLSHDTVVANQDLTISGNGFSASIDGSDFCIVEGQITIGNVAVEIDDTSDCPAAVLTAEGATEGILLTTGGTFTITVRIHDPVGSTPVISTSLLNEATHELKVIDTNGAEGTLEVTIAERTLEVTPAAARPRDVVTIIGKNFIADNSDGLSTTVDVEYKCGSSGRMVTADPDVSGNFRETLRIPSGCSIPSTNILTAKISAGAGPTGVVETVTHEIPEGLITIEPGRGPSGTLVSVRGEGFRTFETVEKIEFGGLGTSRTVNTDGSGDFLIEDILVPGLDPGIHAVKVEVSTGSNRTTSSTSFEVIESGLIGAPTPVAEVYDMTESLLRVFWFSNTTKAWDFNDKRDEFADANTLDELISGGLYWFLIDQDVELDVEGVLLTLTCTGDDCWNLVVWP